MTGGMKVGRRLLIQSILMPCLLISSPAAPLNAADWLIWTVGDGNGGLYPSLRIDNHGNAHVVYFDPPENQLRYSFWDHNLKKWFTEAVDKSSGFCSLALDSRGRPHISYNAYGTGALKYAYWDGSAWKQRVIQLEGKRLSYYTSIALNAEDKPIISFYQEYSTALFDMLRLRTASWTGDAWELQTVDPDQGSGKFNSLAIDPTGVLQVAYGNVEYKNASLRYAHWDGRGWVVEILEGKGIPGTSMWSVAMVVAKNSEPHLVYTDVTNRVVKYATKHGNRWSLEVVDRLAEVGYPDRNGIALDSSGNPYVSYYDAGRAVLKVAHRENGKWITEVVDRNSAGFTSSLQISEGGLWVAYGDSRGRTLRVARRPVPPEAPK